MPPIKIDMVHEDHPEDEKYDDIHIFVVPRWKESELSGDEWRFSYTAECKRKGEVICTITAHTLDWLLKSLQWRMMIAGEEGKINIEAWNRTRDKCDQPGCANVATIFYKRINRYTSRGEELASSSFYDGKTYRQFCESHSHRGDCDLDDADHNYVSIEDPTKESK